MEIALYVHIFYFYNLYSPLDIYLSRGVHFERPGSVKIMMSLPHTRPNAAEQRVVPL